MLIYTFMAYGMPIKYEVLEAVAQNECDLMVVSSERSLPVEENRARNLIKCLDLAQKEEDIIIINYDVVMPRGCAQAVKAALFDNSIVTAPTKPCHTPGAYPEIMCHGIMGVRKDMIETFRNYLEGTQDKGCCVCSFLRDYKPGKVLWEQRGYEV